MAQALERIVLHHLEGSRAGQVDSYSQPVVLVGRAPDCHLVLASDKGVSGKHCEIRQSGGQFEVVDSSSTNGTFVGDERVTSRVLKSGDAIRFGWMGPVVRVEFDEAVRAVHAGHPDDAQSTVMMSARRIQQAAADSLIPAAAREPANPAPPRTAAPPATPVVESQPAAPAPPRAAPPPRPAQHAQHARAAAGRGWSAGRWAGAIAVTAVAGMLLGVAVWLLVR
ncbi:MAG: FHA domain-containing protein [Pseudomonadota bacterium]